MPDDMIVDDGGRRQRTVKVNYPSNSKASQGDEKKPLIEKVIVGEVHQRKKPIRSRIGDSVMAEGADSVMQYIVMEVLLPAAKDMVIDAVSQGVQRMFYGDSRGRRSNTGSSPTNYSKISRPSGYSRESSRSARAVHDFDDIILETRGEAEDVLERLRDLIREYDSAKVSDLYDLVGLTGSFADERWGWSNLRTARVQSVRGGYLLDLPKTEPLDL